MTPLVSVAVPVLNGERYLAEAIESVLGQEGVELEVRVVDNGSTDGSVEVARSYLPDGRVSVVVNDENVNAYGSLNRALAESRGEYYVPFAADDVMLPGNLARKLAVLEETGAGFVHSPAVIIDGEGRVTGSSDPIGHLPALVEAPGFFRLAAPVNPVLTQAVVVRREAFLALGGFDGRVVYCGDWLAWMALGLRHAVATLHEPLLAYRMHAEQATADGLARGWHARDVPAAAAAIFADEAMPEEWRKLRGGIVAARLSLSAWDLDRARLRRSDRGTGYAAYVLAGWALLESPADLALRGRYLELVRAAGLLAPAIPFDAVALAAANDSESLVAGAEALRAAGLLRSLAVGAAPERLDETAAVLGLALEPAPLLDVDLVPVSGPLDLYRAGTLALAPFGSPAVLEAESLGTPAFPLDRPSPFTEVRDPARWHLLVPQEDPA